MNGWTQEAKRKKRKQDKEIEEWSGCIGTFIAVWLIIIGIGLLAYAGYRVRTEGLKKFIMPVWNGEQVEE